MSKRLGGVVLLLTVAGPAGQFAAADVAAPPERVTRAQFALWFKEISNWGRWGKDDELGTVNLITPEKRKAAAALVRDGVSVSLALDLNKSADTLNTNPFEQTLTVGEFGGHAVAEDRYAVRYHGFTHSHMDGLAHFAHAGTMYNGVSVDVLESSRCPRRASVTARPITIKSSSMSRSWLSWAPGSTRTSFGDGQQAGGPPV